MAYFESREASAWNVFAHNSGQWQRRAQSLSSPLNPLFYYSIPFNVSIKTLKALSPSKYLVAGLFSRIIRSLCLPPLTVPLSRILIRNFC